MSSPQWPGQPGYPPGQQPPPPPGPFPPGGYPPPPPPRNSGAGVLIALLAGGGLVVVIIIAVVIVVVANSGDKPRRHITLPTYSPPTFSVPTPTTTSSTSGGIDGVLGATIRTAKGNTFTRAGTKEATCSSRADKELTPVFSRYPCVGLMRSAVYANSSRTVMTVISIAQFADESTASSVSDATNQGAAPILLMPSIESGLPRLGREPESWTRSWTQGARIIYAQSYWASGAATGGREGTVYVTAGELGTEVSNVLVWTN
ncbi:hypothetical protein BTM25_12440 [Actinomadura rubteroloni]|uniref:Uncharacterized protein n=1 Tax=Actinomadura rubteroloni TaxID=1926885 RepID=A0A2P4UP55_9ACTN|nr:hypothetical protein [Actinomadura rubteroloni]POM26836.1 hypothetical protein BTM25_12440 [Actinomadura rubteroloni]